MRALRGDSYHFCGSYRMCARFQRICPHNWCESVARFYLERRLSMRFEPHKQIRIFFSHCRANLLVLIESFRRWKNVKLLAILCTHEHTGETITIFISGILNIFNKELVLYIRNWGNLKFLRYYLICKDILGEFGFCHLLDVNDWILIVKPIQGRYDATKFEYRI